MKQLDRRITVAPMMAIIAEAAIRTMTPEERAALLTPEGEDVFRGLWPEFVSESPDSVPHVTGPGAPQPERER